MIYEIFNKDVYNSTQQGATIICWSADGKYALISADFNLTSIEIINQFDDDELSNLLTLSKWQQPCPTC